MTLKGKRKLTEDERKKRIRLTNKNADAFLSIWRERRCSFAPVGVIQGLDAGSYGKQLHEYLEMGYSHIALGGLVPRTDEEIKDIVIEVTDAAAHYHSPPWIHLLGIFRPKLQELFRQRGINSFDSATYFRKAWLRSDQNYLGADGEWYGAIRVPPTSDARTLIRLKKSGVHESTIKKREQEVMQALRRYAKKRLSVDKCLKTVLSYDRLLNRGEYSNSSMATHYRKTLEARPWERCPCTVCQSIGINALIFRGYNRNKRRGAHNTFRLYQLLKHVNSTLPLAATTTR